MLARKTLWRRMNCQPSCRHQFVNQHNSKKPRLLGWYVGLGVLMITLGVVFGLVGIFIVAKKKQRYRINEPIPTIPTNSTPRADLGGLHHLALLPVNDHRKAGGPSLRLWNSKGRHPFRPHSYNHYWPPAFGAEASFFCKASFSATAGSCPCSAANEAHLRASAMFCGTPRPSA